jgi:hypothetical protein
MFENNEPPYRKTGLFEFEGNIRRPLTEQEKRQAELYKALNWSLLYGAQGYGKNYAAARRVREHVARMRNGNNVSDRTGETLRLKPQMPQKICNYRKPKLYWFGELHGSNNFVHNAGMRASHWAVTQGKMQHLAMGTTTGRFADADPLKNRRLVPISEYTEWVETRTLDVSSKAWEPKGEIFVMSGKPLKINDKSKETIERQD